MVKNKTYNNVVNTLLLMAEKHYGIHTTSVGDIWELDLEKNTKFPLLHINPTSVTTGDSTLTYNFQIFVMSMTGQESDWTENRESAGRNEATSFDKLYKPLTDEQSVYSEMLQIATDFISMLRHSKQQSMYSNDGVPYGTNDINFPLYFTEGQYNLEPFQERFDNLCVGWVFNIGVLVQNDFNSCGVPNPQTRGSGF
jgi:hypothetical protein